MKKFVCIFCGARTGFSQRIQEQVNVLCEQLIAADYHLVYGGGNAGLMRYVADIFLLHGRTVIGVRPNRLIEHEDHHPGISEMIIVDDLFERKAKMMMLSDAFIALPGGLGTLDELLEVYAHVKIGFANKRCAVFNIDGYYNQLLGLLDTMVEHGFLSVSDKQLLIVTESPLSLINELERLVSHRLIDKVAYIKLHEGKILSSKSKGKLQYYIPGGKREGSETDIQTLSREIKEELSVELITDSVTYMGSFMAQADGHADGILVRMTCYEANYEGELNPSHEIEEITWLSYKDIDLVSPVDKIIFEHLSGKELLK